jgi:hypothetical protein
MRRVEGFEAQRRARKWRAAVAAGVCAVAALAYSQPHSKNTNPGASHPPAEITKQREAYLAKLPLVPDSELPAFIRQQRKTFKADIKKIKSLDGTSLSSGQTIKWIAKLSLGNSWKIKVTPMPKEQRPQVDPQVTNFSMATFNQLDDGDGNWVTNDTDDYGNMAHKQTWKLMPAIAGNPNLKDNISDNDDESSMTYDDDNLRLSIIAYRKLFETDDAVSLDNEDDSQMELIDEPEMIAHADINLNVGWYAGDKRRGGKVTRTDADTVASEKQMNDEEYRVVRDKALYYRSYMQNRKPVTIVSESRVMGGATYDEFRDIITLPEKFAARDTTQDHESAHALFFEMKDQPSTKKQAKEFTKLADAITKTVEPDPTKQWDNKELNSCKDAYSKIYRIFDESTYEEETGCSAGHPADNADELFASAFTVMKYYPQEVVDNFQQLDEKNQTEALLVIKQILELTDTLSSFSGNNSLLPDSSPLRSLF